MGHADTSSPEGFLDRQSQAILQMQTEFMAIAGEFRVRVEGMDFFQITEAKGRLISNARIRKLIRRGRDFGRMVSSYLSGGEVEGFASREEHERAADVVDEIIWFKIQIQFRLVLAGMVRIWETERRDVDTEPGLSSDGFAKSVLESLGRFETALNWLKDISWGSSAQSERLTSELGEIREQVLTLFPSCREFVRPGLDDRYGVQPMSEVENHSSVH
jgi:hypothetical protein